VASLISHERQEETMSRLHARTIFISTVSAFALLAAGTSAGAAITGGPVDNSGVIHGCWTNAAVNGTHVFVLQDAGTNCPKGTTAISWNQQGPAGPAGPAGATGLAGPAGATGPAGPKGDIGALGPAGPAGATGPAGAAGPAGPAGADGSTVLNGTGAPADTVGHDGDFYLDTAAGVLYGPKAGGTWPANGTSLIGGPGATGPAGPQGPQGPAGGGLSCTYPGGGTGTVVTSTDLQGNVTLTCHNPNCVHSAGLTVNGNLVTYTDCNVALGTPGDPTTYTDSMAFEARKAYIFAANVAIGSTGGRVSCDGGTDNAEELSGPSIGFIVWTFAGPNAGYVHVDGIAPVCPTTSDPTWN
jgi:hypothetical protein